MKVKVPNLVLSLFILIFSQFLLKKLSVVGEGVQKKIDVFGLLILKMFYDTLFENKSKNLFHTFF